MTPTWQLDDVHVAQCVLECALNKCVPCGYKVIVHGDDTLIPNQRPELCKRFKANQEHKANFPFIDPSMHVLIVHDNSFVLTALLKGFVNNGNQLTVVTAEPRATVSKIASDMPKRIKKYEQQGIKIHYETDLNDLASLGSFDRIIWNFLDVNAPLDTFLEHATAALLPNGQIHITTKTTDLVQKACDSGLKHLGSFVFDRSICPSYRVPYSDCNTAIFSAKESNAAIFPCESYKQLTDEIITQVRNVLHQLKKTDVPAKKKVVKKEKDTVDVPYEKEYFDLMNLKPKGKKHKIKRKQEYESNQEGKSRPSKRVLPVRMENGKRKKGW